MTERLPKSSDNGSTEDSPFPSQIEVEIIDRKHAVWRKFQELWALLKALAEGGWRLNEIQATLLVKRPKEPQDVYAARLKAFTAETPLGTALTWYDAALFGKEPELTVQSLDAKGRPTEKELDEPVAALLKRLHRNIEGKHDGLAMMQFFRRLFRKVAIFQSAWILIDREPLPEGSTQVDEQSAAHDPYAVLWEPQSVINWSEDERTGEMVEVVARTETVEGSILEGRSVTVERWLYWDRRNFAIYRRDKAEKGDASKFAELESWGPHALSALNRVPMLRIQVPDQLWLANNAWLPLVNYIDLDNTIAWILRIATLPHPVVYSDEDASTIKLAENEILFLGPGDKFEWAEPEGRSLAVAMDRMGRKREEIFRGLHLMAQARDSSATASAQSGESKREDLMPALNILEAFGDCLRPWMSLLIKWMLESRGAKDFEVSTRGFKFVKDDPIQIARVRDAVVEADVGSDTLVLELNKDLATAAQNDPEIAIREKIMKEIDASGSPTERAEKRRAAEAANAVGVFG